MVGIGTKMRSTGVALVMVLLVLSALAIIAAPFAVSMALHDRSSRRFEADAKARRAADAIRNHVIAKLQRTLAARESDAEAMELEEKRPPDPARRAAYQPAPRSGLKGIRSSRGMPKQGRRRSLVRRADLGEAPLPRGNNVNMGKRALAAAKRETTSIDMETPSRLLVSEKGPPPKAEDPASDMAVELPPEVLVESGDGSEGSSAIGFRSRQLSASAVAEDEQGKINLNTAPPNLMGNLLGVTRLLQPLAPGADVVQLEDASPFRTDMDSRTLDGAVVVVHPDTARAEALTYRSRRGNDLVDCFRGAFLSVPHDEPFPIGSFVYDLRGYKIGHHLLRAHAEGGFAPQRLGEFASIEAVRGIASWQIASLFLIRFRGQGLTVEFLQKNGISPRKLEELGLDPAIFSGADSGRDAERKEELDAAVKSLRKLRVPGSLIESLRKARGARGVIGFEARISSLKPAEAAKAAEEMKKALERDRREAPHFDRKYLEAALENLGEVYKTPGIETLLPEELARLQDAITVSSALPARWSEAQTNPDQLPAGPTWGESFRSAQGGELGGGALIRIRLAKDPAQVEFNRVVHRGGNIPTHGFQLAYPLQREYGPHEARIDALQRHPVNVNTASERVLRAVLTGVSGYKRTKEGDHTVTPEEAARLASLIRSRLPLKGHDDLRELLFEAAASDTIHEEDVEPLLLNAIQPNDPHLRHSTTGFTYATGDVYTIESLGVVRNDAGGEEAAVRLREIVMVSSSEPLRLGLFSQFDYSSGLFTSDPYCEKAPECEMFHRVHFPGIRSHMVLSSPLLLRNAFARDALQKNTPLKFPFAGGEMGTLRLMPSESNKNRETHGEIFHFRNTFQGLELGPGEPFVIDISSDESGSGGGMSPGGAIGKGLKALTGAGRTGGASGAGGKAAGGVTAGGGAAGAGVLDLTNMPASIDFHVRFRTYPEVLNKEGMAILIDAGAEEERNRITLLYDRSRAEFVARIYDSSLPDPSIPEGKQYLEVRAKRPLDLETWYHLRLAWDGTYTGGLQLFIDGLPVGTSSFSTELAADVPAQGVRAVTVKDRSVLPSSAGNPIVVRVGSELIELESGGQIRQAKPSHYEKWREQAENRFRAKMMQRTANGSGQPLPPPPQPLSAAEVAERQNMRGPWNQRASAPGLHVRGTPVTRHGYSLEIMRKIRDQKDLEYQASMSNDPPYKPVWTPCGLTLGDDLLPWKSFPPGVIGIHHYCPPPPSPPRQGDDRTTPTSGIPTATGAPPGGEVIVPVFVIDRQLAGSLVPGGGESEPGPGGRQRNRRYAYTPEIQMPGGQVYNAVDFFQQRGVLLFWPHAEVVVGDIIFIVAPPAPTPPQVDLYYEKSDRLDPQHPAAKPQMPDQFNVYPLLKGQTKCLLIKDWYPATSGPGSAGRPPVRQNLLWTGYAGAWLRQISVLADRSISGLYPMTGILEIRGSPPVWSDPPRPDLQGAPLFENHPDDTVEWIRYVKVYPKYDRLFIGRYRPMPGKRYETDNFMEADPFDGQGYNNHRGYPERYDDLKNQMFHRKGEPIRLVMELADGGAGFGDYVSIATNDPSVAETLVRRVYRVSERDDGRFFVSLIDVDSSGREVPGVARYMNTYTSDMNPRLVKFPSGALPQIGTGRMVFFGEAGAGSRTAGSPPGSSSRSVEEEETAGTIIDEVRRSLNKRVRVDPGRGQRVRHVVVPLDNGKVRYQDIGNGMAAISGSIPEGRSVGRENPLEILVVSTGREPDLFAPKVDRGLLRIGEELFFFENPNAGDETGSVAQGAAPGGQQSGQGVVKGQWTRPDDASATDPAAGSTTTAQFNADTTGERRYDARMQVWPSPPIAQVNGSFEREGFARIDDASAQLHNFYEIFYYRQFGGNRFVDCLRGQFQSPIVASHSGNHRLTNVTTRLRLIGRSLLGTQRAAHGFADPVSLMPYLDYTEVMGPLTNAGLPVRETRDFPRSGHLLLDSGLPGVPFEIIAYRGIEGDALFDRPRDEDGNGILRSSFGTIERPIHTGMFAYGLPLRHYDRYQALTESEDLAYLQKSFRSPGAHWRSLQWRTRRPRGGQERLCDIVVAARVDGVPDWSEKPTNQRGGLYFFEDKSGGDARAPDFPLDARGDELEVRIYFRYKSGSFMRISEDYYRDDWKETPVLEWLSVEYEKAGRILRHEEPPY